MGGAEGDSRLARGGGEWPARPSVADSPALGPNGASFVRIAPSWLSRDGGDAKRDIRARRLPGAPSREHDQVALDAAVDVRLGGRG